MQILDWLGGFGPSFLREMKLLFLSENSRLWWAWILVFFPLVGALIGARELRRGGQAVTASGLFKFVFPGEIYRSASFRADVILTFSLYVIYAAILVVAGGLSSAAITKKLVIYFNSGALDRLHLASYKDVLPANLGMHLLFTLLVILVYDFGFTMLHYAFHRVPALWNLHRIHHSAEVLTPLTVTRFHLVEYVLQKLVEGLTLGTVFGIFYFFHPKNLDIYTVLGLSAFGIFFSSIGVFRHSHIWISYGILDYVFCSPAMHQIHHSKEARHLDKNMSQIFSFWDALLGTLYVPKGRETFEVGLTDRPDWNRRNLRRSLSLHFRPSS